MYCRTCGRQIPDDSRFCQFCGKDVVGINYNKVSASQPQKEYTQNTSNSSYQNERISGSKIQNNKPASAKRRSSTVGWLILGGIPLALVLLFVWLAHYFVPPSVQPKDNPNYGEIIDPYRISSYVGNPIKSLVEGHEEGTDYRVDDNGSGMSLYTIPFKCDYFDVPFGVFVLQASVDNETNIITSISYVFPLSNETPKESSDILMQIDNYISEQFGPPDYRNYSSWSGDYYLEELSAEEMFSNISNLLDSVYWVSWEKTYKLFYRYELNSSDDVSFAYVGFTDSNY